MTVAMGPAAASRVRRVGAIVADSSLSACDEEAAALLEERILVFLDAV
jgi:hypothetical protein